MSDKIRLKVHGMNCMDCAAAVEVVLKEKKGISKVRVDYKTHRADLEYDSGIIDLKEIIGEIRKIGFDASQ